MIRYAILILAFFAVSIIPGAAEQQNSSLTSSPQIENQDEAAMAQSLFEEAVRWICANFDLPPTAERPAIEFASKARLTRMRIDDRANWQGFREEQGDAASERNVVAVYDTSSRTIFLPEGWKGKSPPEQSIFIHELVHHLQNVAGQHFECPAAREKVAYLAQAKWLENRGMSLEKEFDLDMFTIVISSACM